VLSEREIETQFTTCVETAVAHHEAGRLAEAEEAYAAALACKPDHAPVLHNLGAIAAAQRDLTRAISWFDRAIAAQPDYALAHLSRAQAHRQLGNHEAAAADYARVVRLEPDNYAAHRALAFLWLDRGRPDRALDHFARTYDLRRGEDRTPMASWSLSHSTREKLKHDAEQFRFLATKRPRDNRFLPLERAYDAVAAGFPLEPTELTPEQREALGDDYNTPIFCRDAPEDAEPVLSPQPGRGAIVARLAEDGYAELDDLLSPRALGRLRDYLLQSTIWHDFRHIPGFLASYVEDGLACPILLQIADEVRRTFPELLGDHALTQAWAFKALRSGAGIQPHLDDGVISLNFWVTPDEANLRPDTGGLVICTAPPPEDWQMTGYQTDAERAAAFVEQHAGATRRIAYGENRAVLFRSRLFHSSDAPHFGPGYEQHRINLTLMFGAREFES
jgi:tetratricopeptide (TPR) repeat protein